MKKWIRILRIGAICCLLPTLFWLTVTLDLSGDYTVEHKYEDRGQFRIHTVGRGEISAPYSKRFYEKAQPGDDIHFGFHHITLCRGGKLVAIEIPRDTRVAFMWILLALFPLLAFVPENRMPARRPLLSIITAAEVITLGVFFIPS